MCLRLLFLVSFYLVTVLSLPSPRFGSFRLPVQIVSLSVHISFPRFFDHYRGFFRAFSLHYARIRRPFLIKCTVSSALSLVLARSLI